MKPKPGQDAERRRCPYSSLVRTSSRIIGLLVVLAMAVAACSSGDSDGANDGAGAGGSTAAEATTTGSEQATTTTVERVELPEGHEIEVQAPSGYDPNKPAPLVVLLHGYGVDGEIQNLYFKFREAADANGMLAVYPDGTENSDGERFWNATSACCAPAGSEVDDSAYILDVIDTVKADYSVDPERVYLVGHSNGGFMSFRMACDHADVIAAIVSLAGSTPVAPDECSPSEPVATLQIHGTADDTILYDGEVLGTDGGDETYPGALETLETWATYNGCDLVPDDPAPEPRRIIVDAEPATVISHSDCDPGGHAELWTAPEGPHIPAITPDFSTQLVEFLLAHPKP